MATLCVRIRRVLPMANAAAFVAAWLIAELAPEHSVRFLRAAPDLVELDVTDPHESVWTAVEELLAETRFLGWELSHH